MNQRLIDLACIAAVSMLMFSCGFGWSTLPYWTMQAVLALAILSNYRRGMVVGVAMDLAKVAEKPAPPRYLFVIKIIRKDVT